MASDYGKHFTILAAVCAFIFHSTCHSAVAGDDPSHPPNLLLITVDTLRPDSLNWISGRNSTPSIDRLAQQGFAFPSAVAPTPITLPSHSSILTGLLPRNHGVRDNGQIMGPEPATLAAELTRRGYTTAAFVSGFPLAAQYGLDRGFEIYNHPRFEGPRAPLERTADSTTAKVAANFDSLPEPWFIWVHYYDPHEPYEPPERFRKTGSRGAYDGEVSFTDEAIGMLIETVETKVKGRLLTVFTADHGESLGEHGEATHGFFIYDSTILVPLIFHFPGRIEPGKSQANARLIDIPATVFELLGLPPFPAGDGRSLTPVIAGSTKDVTAAYVETFRPWLSYGWSPLRAIREPYWKLIEAPKPELYDLRTDPTETINQIDKRRPQAARLFDILDNFQKLAERESKSANNPDNQNKLRALGYVAANLSFAKPLDGLADPKDRLDQWNALGRAEFHLSQGRFNEAIAAYDSVLAEDGLNRYALARSGIAHMEAGNLQQAIPRLTKAVEIAPDIADTQYALAHVLTRARQYQKAIFHWRELIRLQPRRAHAWSNLGATLGLAGQTTDAANALRKAVILGHDEHNLKIKLAFAEFAAGDPAAAIIQFQEAATLMDEQNFPHAGALGILLAQQRNEADARIWLIRSQPAEREFAEARFQLAMIEARAGDRAGAKQALQEAIDAAPEMHGRATNEPLLADLVVQNND